MELKAEELQREPLFTNRRANSQVTRRTRLPWPAGQPFKILSLDGGGLRGVFTAAFVRELERELTNGTPLARYFDLVAGTSTGGIVAIGVGLELPADDIFSFYEVDGKKIFPPGRWYYPWNNSVARRIWKLFRPAYC